MSRKPKRPTQQEIIFDSTYRGYKINNPPYSQGCYKNSLDKVIDKIEDMTNKHSKVLFSRLDMRKPQGMPKIENSSRKVTRTIEGFKREQERKAVNSKHALDMNIIRSTECEGKDKNTHDHLAILANGNCVQNAYPWGVSLERHAERLFQVDNNHGLVHFCRSSGKSGIIIDRNKDNYEEMKAKAIYAASYVTKVRGKENTPKGTHKISLSQTKKKK